MEEDVRQALTMLISLRDGDRGIPQVVGCGRRAVPALRAVLFGRELGGLYETRRRAVEALAQLGAFDVLIDYLKEPHTTADPVEDTAQEAITNAAARSLISSNDPRSVPTLLALARQRPLAGVIEALSKLQREEALPYFIKGLTEDFTRPAAEAAIRAVGAKVRLALMDAAILRVPSDQEESPSSKRRRLSALKLIADFGPVAPESWSMLYTLMEEDDPQIASAACHICLASADKRHTPRAIGRLIELLGTAGWQLSEDIEDDLVHHFEDAKDVIETLLGSGATEWSYCSPEARTRRALLRVAARIPADGPHTDR